MHTSQRHKVLTQQSHDRWPYHQVYPVGMSVQTGEISGCYAGCDINIRHTMWRMKHKDSNYGVDYECKVCLGLLPEQVEPC